MQPVQPRRRTVDPHDDAQWESLVSEASARPPEALSSPQLSAPSAKRPRAAGKSKTTRYLNITRMDYPKCQGYFVRVRWKGDARSKLFSDGVYGDRLSALAAAIEWRDQVTRELGKPRAGAPPPASLGVHRRMRGGRAVYEATWSVNGKRGRTTYSIQKHGAKQARALAIAARQRAMSDRA